MAQGKNKIIVYRDWLDNFEDLTDEELGKLMRHFFEYVNDKNPVLEDRFLKIAWKPIETTLKRDLKSWEQHVEKQRSNGLKGGRPKKPKKPSGFSENPTKPKKADSDTDSVTVKDINNIYSLYPSKCVVKHSSTGKSKDKNHKQIRQLLKSTSVGELKYIIERYVTECKKDQTYMKNFSTFLNNLPDYETQESKQEVKKPYVPFINLYDDE